VQKAKSTEERGDDGYLGKVANNMAASGVGLGHHIKQERLHIIIQGLVVKEEFCQKTEVLAVKL